jgi:hypothetical protein
MIKRIFNLRNVAIFACLAATAIFASCEKEEDPISEPGDEFTIPDDGKVPSTSTLHLQKAQMGKSAMMRKNVSLACPFRTIAATM